MTTHRDDTVWLRGRESRLSDLLQELSSAEIEQFAQYDGICEICQTPFYGILDESKLRLPIAGLINRYNRYLDLRYVDVGRVRGLAGGYSTHYEVRQDLVNSGTFSRAQLSPSGLFSNHELEVNDRSFLSIRPKRCDCCFGSEPELTEEDLLALAVAEAADLQDTLTSVEADFIAGKPVRTGFRSRSREAIRRRRKRSRLCRVSLHFPEAQILGVSVPSGTVQVRGFNPPTEIKKAERPSKRYWGRHPGNNRRKFARFRLGKEIYSPPLMRIKPHHWKYWYFLRVRGVVHRSLHHPFPDE